MEGIIKMRVGLITLVDHYNYGNRLQCYASQYVLEQNNCEVTCFYTNKTVHLYCIYVLTFLFRTVFRVFSVIKNKFKKLLKFKAFDKEYSVLMGVRYYVWSVGFMNTNDSDNYNLTQSDVSNLAYYLSQFYYYTQLSAYKDKEVTMTSDNEKYLNKMREDMGVLLKKYYHITDEDLEAIDTFSSARIEQCLIQRG